MICREAECAGKLRMAEPGAPGWEYMMICSECLTLQELQGVPINCNRCGENLGQHLEIFTGATEILVDPTWCSHLCSRPDGDVCPGCGGVCGEPEPSDLDHPYYSCPDCAGGA